MSQCRLVPEADGTHFRCDDCGEEMLASQLDMITDIEERLTPGGIVPAGQCPHCGALAYYADGYAPSWSAQATGERLIEQAAAATTALKKAEDFIVGFEDDPVQVGIPELLEDIRTAIAGAPADPLRDAAPELLHWLKGIAGRLLDLREHLSETEETEIGLALAAIAKAEGRP